MKAKSEKVLLQPNRTLKQKSTELLLFFSFLIFIFCLNTEKSDKTFFTLNFMAVKALEDIILEIHSKANRIYFTFYPTGLLQAVKHLDTVHKRGRYLKFCCHLTLIKQTTANTN